MIQESKYRLVVNVGATRSGKSSAFKKRLEQQGYDKLLIKAIEDKLNDLSGITKR